MIVFILTSLFPLLQLTFHSPSLSIETDKRQIRDKIVLLSREIGLLGMQREQHRKSRMRLGLPVVALVGYTNAGNVPMCTTLCVARFLTYFSSCFPPYFLFFYFLSYFPSYFLSSFLYFFHFFPGKSSLLNRLSRAGVLAENMLFATLDPTTRRIRLPRSGGGEGAVVLDANAAGARNKGQEVWLID